MEFLPIFELHQLFLAKNLLFSLYLASIDKNFNAIGIESNHRLLVLAGYTITHNLVLKNMEIFGFLTANP
jgi:hypothetical protein